MSNKFYIILFIIFCTTSCSKNIYCNDAICFSLNDKLKILCDDGYKIQIVNMCAPIDKALIDVELVYEEDINKKSYSEEHEFKKVVHKNVEKIEIDNKLYFYRNNYFINLGKIIVYMSCVTKENDKLYKIYDDLVESIELKSD